jgi:hypothetical protein
VGWKDARLLGYLGMWHTNAKPEFIPVATLWELWELKSGRIRKQVLCNIYDIAPLLQP